MNNEHDPSSENTPPPTQPQYTMAPPDGGMPPQKPKTAVWVWVLGICAGVCCCGGVILAAILFPVFAEAKIAAKKTTALSHAKEIGTSIAIYLSDNDDFFPPMQTTEDVTSRLKPYLKGDAAQSAPSFTFNAELSSVSATALLNPQESWMLNSPVVEGSDYYAVAFADTHARIFKSEEMQAVKAKPLEISK